MESDSDEVTAHKVSENPTVLKSINIKNEGYNTKTENEAVGSLERIYKAALQYPHNTMSKWRPNLS
jgi:hypothetical protein